MDYLPIALDVRGRTCLVVGGGHVALRKIEWLMHAGAKLRVVAMHACAEAQAHATNGRLTLLLRGFEDRDLDGAHLVIAATDDRELNARISAAANACALLVNVVDDPALCSFIVPALVDRSPVVVAISTQGASPVLARLVRRRIEALLHPRLGELARFASEQRKTVRDAISDPSARRTLWERALDGPIADAVLAGGEHTATEALRAALASQAPRGSAALSLVALPESLDAITLGAMRALGHADFVAHDEPTLAAVSHFGRRDAQLHPFVVGDEASLRAAVQAAQERLEQHARVSLACSERSANIVERALRDAQIAFTPSPAVA